MGKFILFVIIFEKKVIRNSKQNLKLIHVLNLEKKKKH